MIFIKSKLVVANVWPYFERLLHLILKLNLFSPRPTCCKTGLCRRCCCCCCFSWESVDDTFDHLHSGSSFRLPAFQHRHLFSQATKQGRPIAYNILVNVGLYTQRTFTAFTSTARRRFVVKCHLELFTCLCFAVISVDCSTVDPFRVLFSAYHCHRTPQKNVQSAF